MVYYNGVPLTDNFVHKRKVERRKKIIESLTILVNTFPSGVYTSDLWLYLVKNGYHYNYRTLHKDLIILESDGLVCSESFFGGKGAGTKKLWKLSLEVKNV